MIVSLQDGDFAQTNAGFDGGMHIATW